MSNEEIVEQIQKGIEVTTNQERLWKSNKGFVYHVIRQICGTVENIDDLAQEGFIGLITAAMKYKPDCGANFLTFAFYDIRKSIYSYYGNCSGCVKIPRYLKERIRKYAQMRQQYRNENGREPTDEECVNQLHISHKALSHLKKTLYNMQSVSIDMGISQTDGESTLLDMLSSDEDIEELVAHSVYNKELKNALDDALGILDYETSAMIRNVYFQKNSMEQTAEIFGCSVQNVSARIGAGFWKILHSRHRERLESFMWDGYEYNEFQHSQYAELDSEDEENEFLI